MIRLKTFLGSNERKVLVNSFFLPNFNYCPVILFVSSSTSLRKIENLHKRALRFLLNKYVSSYERLLQNSSKASINLRNHRALCTEVFKTMIDSNPTYMKTFLSALFQIRDQYDRIMRWISLHPKQAKLDMELRAWEALHQKFGIHTL